MLIEVTVADRMSELSPGARDWCWEKRADGQGVIKTNATAATIATLTIVILPIIQRQSR